MGNTEGSLESGSLRLRNCTWIFWNGNTVKKISAPVETKHQQVLFVSFVENLTTRSEKPPPLGRERDFSEIGISKSNSGHHNSLAISIAFSTKLTNEMKVIVQCTK